MQLFTPPNPFPKAQPSVFLAGSISIGKVKYWQDEVADALEETDWIIFNPRRPDWDDTWKEDLSDARFVEQVNWELEAQETASHILMYFSPDSKAPISLLELGISAKSGKVRVCCPKGFWKRGNVEIVCQRYGIPFYEELTEMVDSLIKDL